MQKRTGQNIFFLFAGAILLFIVMTIILVLGSRDDREVAPSPSPVQPTVVPARTNPPVVYAPTSTQKMLDALSQPQPISEENLAAKQKIISLLPQGAVSGVVYSSSTIRIDYTKAADQIQVEILTVDIGKAKNDAVIWLKSQGMSQEGICALPIVFYLNRGVANELQDIDIAFSPLAEGC